MLLSPSCLAPLCGSVFSWFCFFFGGHTHNDTQDVIVHVTLIAGSDPTSLCFVFLVWCGLVVVVGVLFAWLFLFLVCVFCFLDGTAHWTAYRSTTSAFVAIDK